MSAHFLIDGYNVIKQTPSLDSEELETSRENLIRLIKKHSLCGSLNNRVTIVFDGQKDIFGLNTEKQFKIIFTKGESADAKIKKLISASTNAKQIVLVTDDKELVYFGRSYGVKMCSVNKFLSKVFCAKHVKTGGKEKEELHFKTARKITEELKKIWLHKP